MEFERPYKREWGIIMKDEYILEANQDNDIITINLNIPDNIYQFIDWEKLKSYITYKIDKVEEHYGVRISDDGILFEYGKHSDKYYTYSDVSELIIGDSIIINDVPTTLKYLAFISIIDMMHNLSQEQINKIIIIENSSVGHEYRFYIDEDTYYYVRPYVEGE